MRSGDGETQIFLIEILQFSSADLTMSTFDAVRELERHLLLALGTLIHLDHHFMITRIVPTSAFMSV